VAVVGEVTFPVKGADDYVELVRRAGALDLEWHFFGTTRLFGFEERIREAAAAPVCFHGRYDRSEIVDLLRIEGIDLCVLLPRVEETFSFVLSEATIAGVPVLAADRGALRERIERGGFGIVVSTVDEAVQRLARFCVDRSELDTLSERARAFRHPSVSENAAAVRKLYENLGMMPSGDGIPSPEALQEIYLHSEAHRQFVASAPASQNGLAAPKYQASAWYPAFVKIKPFIPNALRQLGRKILVRFEQRPALRLDPSSGRGIQRVSNLRVVRRGSQTTAYEAEGPDPHIVFSTQSLPPNSVRKVRFRLRRASNGPAFAQLFWRHSPDEGFTEDNSATIALDGNTDTWREYAFLLDDPKLRSKWNTGGEIFEMRFDPVNVPGEFEMGKLELLG